MYLEYAIMFPSVYMPAYLHKGPSINYVTSVGEGGSPKDDLLNRTYLIKKDDKMGKGVKNCRF